MFQYSLESNFGANKIEPTSIVANASFQYSLESNFGANQCPQRAGRWHPRVSVLARVEFWGKRLPATARAHMVGMFQYSLESNFGANLLPLVVICLFVQVSVLARVEFWGKLIVILLLLCH